MKGRRQWETMANTWQQCEGIDGGDVQAARIRPDSSGDGSSNGGESVDEAKTAREERRRGLKMRTNAWEI